MALVQLKFVPVSVAGKDELLVLIVTCDAIDGVSAEVKNCFHSPPTFTNPLVTFFQTPPTLTKRLVMFFHVFDPLTFVPANKGMT